MTGRDLRKDDAAASERRWTPTRSFPLDNVRRPGKDMLGQLLQRIANIRDGTGVTSRAANEASDTLARS